MRKLLLTLVCAGAPGSCAMDGRTVVGEYGDLAAARSYRTGAGDHGGDRRPAGKPAPRLDKGGMRQAR